MVTFGTQICTLYCKIQRSAIKFKKICDPSHDFEFSHVYDEWSESF